MTKTVSREARTPLTSLAQTSPEQLAALAKLVKSNNTPPQRETDGSRKPPTPNIAIFRQRLSRKARKKSDSEAILKLLPDVELGIRILTSCILAPSDMTSTELNWLAPENLLPGEIAAPMIKLVRQHFETVYKIKPLLPKILRGCLAEEGAYAVAAIPENVIDDIINSGRRVSLENLSSVIDTQAKLIKPIGILGAPGDTNHSESLKLSSEQFGVTKINTDAGYVCAGQNEIHATSKYIYVTDNPAVLSLSKIHQTIRKNLVKSAYGNIGTESMKKLSPYKIESSLYGNKTVRGEQVVTMKRPDELSRKSVGHPLIKKFPVESVIPVFASGEPEKQIGFFICLDEEGVPLQAVLGDNYYASLSNGFGGSSSSVTSSLISRVNTNLSPGAQFDPTQERHIEMAMKIYSELIEKDLLSRVANGLRTTNISISTNEQIYDIMLARTLARKLTQILYIPADYFTYFAFKHGEDGIGRSLLDDTATVNALRVVLMFSDVVGSIKNSIGRTAVTMKLDPRSPDPIKDIEMAQNELVRARRISVPLNVSNVNDITDFIQRAGFEWKFEGHPDIPDMSMDFNDIQSNKQKPDSDLQESLKKLSMTGLYLTSEMVDNGFNSEFAASVVANNILFSKRIMELQEIFNPQLTDHLRKCAAASEPLVTSLKGLLVENKDKIKIKDFEIFDYAGEPITDDRKEMIVINELLRLFLEQFSVELPKPTNVTIEQQISDLQTYADAIEKGIEMGYLNDQLINDNTMGEFSGNLETFKALWKAHYVRKWMAEKGVLTELADMTSVNEQGNIALDIKDDAEKHMLALLRHFLPTVAMLTAIKDRVQKGAQELNLGTPEEVEPSDSGSGTGGGSEEAGGGGDQFDMGEFDMGTGQGQAQQQAGDQAQADSTAQQEPEQLEDENDPERGTL